MTDLTTRPVPERQEPDRSHADPPEPVAADPAPAARGVPLSRLLVMARLTAKSVQRLALAPGKPVFAVIKSVSFERS